MDNPSSAENIKKFFKNKPIYERYINMMILLKDLRKKTKDMHKDKIQQIQALVAVDELPPENEVNKYLNNLVETTMSDIFNIVTTNKVEDKVTGEKKPKQYDSYIMSLSLNHPDEYSDEDFLYDMKAHFEGDDEQ